ncbi:hypothetical protein Q428_08280 [Fervidicella metallireducens AeB]|uniref:Uncharacterized protein n=1 Tax=Fervidicella metallireducens AeB TaxID=1403537 RepID=A0A017RUU5_9CLOT|nr:hypothetical protein [Fervidicella metallireducens]EYE88386.1 hypothetical protein Q428_08280 [Fervidicella metallireducens AeB]
MSFKETLAKKYADTYFKKYGDRLTQVQGHVLSVKVTTKTILWIYNILKVDVLVKPERSKAVVRCQYVRKKWFKKPIFMDIKQGNIVIIQGLKGKKGKDSNEAISILNIKNLTTKKDLIPVDQKIQKVQQKQFIK